MAAIDYYDNEQKWGDYAYTLLQDIINDYMMSRSSDDYTSDTPRHQILYQAMKGMRELYYDVLQEISGIALDVSASLQVTLPPDYVNYVRISWLDEVGQLHPMAVDNKMTIARDYLQAEDYELLFDDKGCVLIGDRKFTQTAPATDPNSPQGAYCYPFAPQSFQPNKNMSNVYANGKYIIDKTRGIIQFDSSIQGRTIVLEYISDGLFTGCEGRPEAELRVNKLAEVALLDYIYYELIKGRRNVPANEKARARKEWYNSRRVAKSRLNALRKSELTQTFKGSTKWIK